MTVAYQLEEAGTRLNKTTVERRPLGPRDVRLDLKYCGICHSDLVAASDKLGGGMYPMVPGHEMVGVVSEIGPQVEGVAVGLTRGAPFCPLCPVLGGVQGTAAPTDERAVGAPGGEAHEDVVYVRAHVASAAVELLPEHARLADALLPTQVA